jgi:hypothetical protein
LILNVDFCNTYLVFLYTKNLKTALDKLLFFSSFLQELAFHRFKNQLKSLLFVSAFAFLAFRQKKPAEKQKQTGLKTACSGLLESVRDRQSSGPG